MKKTLLALAAIAASSAAFAQSSVTLYGVVDASLESVKGDDTVTRVSSDNLASSRLGFKGTEDLGNGLKANFVLESNMKMDTGANGGGSTRFFDRAAWVGVAGGFGELRLGRQDTSIGLLAGNSSILGAQGYDDLKIAKTRSPATAIVAPTTPSPTSCRSLWMA
jgi:GBP family porin